MNQPDFSYWHPSFEPDEQYIAQWSYTPENSKFTFNYSEVRDGIEKLIGIKDKIEYKKWINHIFMPAHPEFNLQNHDDREELIHALCQIGLSSIEERLRYHNVINKESPSHNIKSEDFLVMSYAQKLSVLCLDNWGKAIFEMFIAQKLPFPEQYSIYNKPCTRLASYTDFGNGIKGCVLMLDWNTSSPQLFLIDNDDRQKGTVYETYNSFLPYEVRLHYNYVDECNRLNNGLALMSVEDYQKYHIVMLCGVRQSELIDDVVCSLFNKQGPQYNFETNRFYDHLHDNLRNNHAAKDVQELSDILENRDEWRQQIISKVMNQYCVTQMLYNTFQKELSLCLTHYATLLKNQGYANHILIGEEMFKQIESKKNGFVWYEWFEEYINDTERIKPMDYTLYSIQEIIAFMAYTKYLYTNPSIDSSLHFEQVSVDERVSAFELYLKGMEDAALKHLQQQDNPLRSHRPTQSEAHDLAISWIEKKFEESPSFLTDDLKSTYQQYEEAFKSNIGWKRQDSFFDDLMELLENRPKAPDAVPYDMVKAMAFVEEKYQHYTKEIEPLIMKSLERWWSKIPTNLRETALIKKNEEIQNTLMYSGFFDYYAVDITPGFMEEIVPLADSQSEVERMIKEEQFACSMEDIFDGINILNEQKLERHLYTNQNRLSEEQIMGFYIYQTSCLFLTSIKNDNNYSSGCPWFTEKATNKEKQEFDKQLKLLCSSNKKTQAAEIKKFLRLQEDGGIIKLPKYGKKPNNSGIHNILYKIYGYRKSSANFSAAKGF